MNRFLAGLLVSLGLAGSMSLEARAQTAPRGEGGPRSCASGERLGRADCTVDQYLLEILEREGVGTAMAELDRLVAIDPDIRRDAHGYAHSIGIAAYTGQEDVGTVFSSCTPAHQSGCYHGVIQAYFVQHTRDHPERLDSEMVNDLCREQRSDPGERWLLFQCAHGMGHGLTMLAGHHLPTALEGCDLVMDPWEREACYGGVFMENIVDATVPHHTVGRPQAHQPEAGGGAHTGDVHHAHSPAVAPADFPPLKREDPLYPCSALEERFLVACYQMQTSAILHFNGYNIASAAVTCAAAPEAYRIVCFQSLGRDISAQTGQDHEAAIRLCAGVPHEYAPACHFGYSKNLVDLTADPADGLAYCRLLDPGEEKRVCYIAIGEQIWVLGDDPGWRERSCAAAESDYIEECRLGAGLPVGMAAAPAPQRGILSTNVDPLSRPANSTPKYRGTREQAFFTP